MHRRDYGIYRVDRDDKGTHGWQVTIQRRNHIWNKLFSDGRWGGSLQARKAARLYRDGLLAKYPGRSSLDRSVARRKNNRSGIPGVSKHQVADKNKRKHWFWIAKWAPAPYKQKTVKFSIAKYGDKGAFKRALAARRTALAKLA